MADAQKVEIGFEGGQVVAVRLTEDELKDLRKQVEKGGWHDVKTEDGVLSVYVGKVAFLRIDSGEHRVGFSLNRRTDARPQAARRCARLGDAGRRAVVAQEPVRLPLRAALLGRSAAPDHHPRPPARGPAPRARRADPGDRPGHRLLHARHGGVGRAPDGTASRSSTCSRSSSTTSMRPRRRARPHERRPDPGRRHRAPLRGRLDGRRRPHRRPRRDPRPGGRPARDPPRPQAQRPPRRRRAVRRPPLHHPRQPQAPSRRSRPRLRDPLRQLVRLLRPALPAERGAGAGAEARPGACRPPSLSGRPGC